MTLRPTGYRHYGADLAKHGYSAFLVHYFDRTSEDRHQNPYLRLCTPSNPMKNRRGNRSSLICPDQTLHS
jgi:hypothetical protein